MSSWWDAVRNWFRGKRKGDFPEPNRENPDRVQHFTGREDWIRQRKNLATGLNSREISEEMSAKIRAQSFFSARVERGHVLDKLREVSDAFTRGEIGQAEARTQLQQFLVSLGYDPQQGGLSNLASTGRMNLILEQNARMAYAVGRWQEGMDPDIKERFPCWRYVGTTSAAPRDSHARYVGHVYSKDDPIWHTIFPPSDFNCKCSVDDCDAPAETAPKEVLPAESGFSFDPAHAFEEFDYDAIKDAELRAKTKAGVMQMLSQTGPTSQTGQTGLTKDEPETNTGKMAKLIGADMIEGEHTREQDLAATNPNFGKGEEWNKNCQRCVYAYEARRRGIDVEAESRFLTGNDPMDDHWKEICSGMQWQQPNEITSQGTKRAIDTAMTGFGNGSRAVVFVEWEGVDPPASHVFIAENVDGKIVYVDPQNNDDNVESNFWIAIPEKTEFARLDNLDFSNYIKLCCKRREP